MQMKFEVSPRLTTLGYAVNLGRALNYVWLFRKTLTFRIEQPRDAVLALHHVEGLLEALAGPARSRVSPVDEIGPVAVDERREGETVPPGAGEVVDADARVLGGGAARPPQKRLSRRQVVFLTDHDVGNLERREKCWG